jgi:hypothetical protein
LTPIFSTILRRSRPSWLLSKDVIVAFIQEVDQLGETSSTVRRRVPEDRTLTRAPWNPGELEGLTLVITFSILFLEQHSSESQSLLRVMEIGTGYMLVKRQVFDKFKDEYPHLNYKPDHVVKPTSMVPATSMSYLRHHVIRSWIVTDSF